MFAAYRKSDGKFYCILLSQTLADARKEVKNPQYIAMEVLGRPQQKKVQFSQQLQDWELIDDPSFQAEELEQELMRKIRGVRDRLLSESDWTQVNDSPLSVEQKQAWADYRQALRDVPENVNLFEMSSIDEVSWPQKPE